MQERLEQILEKEIQERTLSLAGIEAVETLRKENEDLAKALSECTEKAKEYRDLSTELKKQVDQLLPRVEESTVMAERELACRRIEIQQEYDKQRGDEMKSLLEMALRNTSLRRTVNEYDSSFPYPTDHYTISRSRETTTTETEE